MWRGTPLPELQEWDQARAEADRLVEVRHTVEEELVEARMRAGRSTEAVGDARQLVVRMPFREHRWALLALALYRTGRQREALDVLRKARATLLDELGLDPGPELVDLEQSILRQDADLLDVPAAGARASSVCPYPGLRPHDADQSELFVGREDDVASCLDRLEGSPLLVVVGPSGSGKSSLVLAGLVPALRARGDVVAVMAPGVSPDATLTSALTAAAAPGVLVVDQLEELFASPDRPGPSLFLDRLTRCAEDGRRVVVSLRADYLASLSAHPAFARLAERGVFLLTPMSAEQLSRAIAEPARRSGLRFEPGLVDLLVRDVVDEAGALPLMSHALVETWARRDGNVLTVGGYTSTGGIRGAVAQSAERLYESLIEEDRVALRAVVRRLVTPTRAGEPIAARVPTRVFDGTPDAPRVLDLLIRARLVTASADTVTMAHESLVRAWPRLRSWLEEDVEGQRILARLQLAAEGWEETGRPDDELYRGIRLHAALEWCERVHPLLSASETQFLDASTTQARAAEVRRATELAEQKRRNRQLRGSLAGVAALLVLALVAGGVASVNGRRAEDNAAAARAAGTETDAARLAAAASAETRPALSLLLARQAVALADTPATEGGLLGSLQGQNLLDRTVTEVLPDTVYRDDQFSPDGTRAFIKGTPRAPDSPVASHYPTVYLVDTSSGATVSGQHLVDPFLFGDSGQPPYPAGMTDDGAAVVVMTESNISPQYLRELRTFDARTGMTEGKPVVVPGENFDTLHVSPRGTTLVSVWNRTLLLWHLVHGGWLAAPSAPELPRFPASDVTRDRVTSVRFSDDGLRAAVLMRLAGPPTAQDPGVAFVFDTRDGHLLTPLFQTEPGHPDPWAVSMSPSGSTFGVGWSDGSVELVDLTATHLPTVTIPGLASVTSIGWSRGGERVVIGDAEGGIAVYAVPDLTELVRFGATGTPVDVAALPTGGAPRVISLDTAGTITTHSLIGASAIATVVPTPRTSAVAAGPPGTFVAVGGDDGLVTIYDQRHLTAPPRRLHLGSALPEAALLDPAHHERVTALAVTPDGGQVIAADRAGRLRIWSTTDWRVQWSSDRLPASFLAVSPDGQRLAVAWADEVSRAFSVWDLHTHARLKSFDYADQFTAGTPYQPTAVAFSPDSSTVAVLFDHELAVYDTTTFRRLHTPLAISGGTGLTFSPDGTELIVASLGRLQGYTVATGVMRETIGAPERGVHLTFSADGRWLIGGDTHALTIWDGHTHRLVLTSLRVPTDGSGDPFALAAVGDHLLVGTQTSLLDLDLDPTRWSSLACSFAGRTLTREEWNRYLPGRPYAPACSGTLAPAAGAS